MTVALAGHEIPQYVPGAAYRHLEFLLGRISSLEQVGDYTTQTGNFMGFSTVDEGELRVEYWCCLLIC